MVVLAVVGASLALVLAFVLEEAFHGNGWQEGQYLIVLATAIAVATAFLGGVLARSRGGNSGSVGFLTGVLTFVLAWLPPIVYLTLNPPT